MKKTSVLFILLVLSNCGGGVTLDPTALGKKTFTDSEMSSMVASSVMSLVASTSSVAVNTDDCIELSPTQKICNNQTINPSTCDIGSCISTWGKTRNLVDGYWDIGSGEDIIKFEYGTNGSECSILKTGERVSGTSCDYEVYIQYISGYNQQNQHTMRPGEENYVHYTGDITFRIVVKQGEQIINVGGDTTYSCSYDVTQTWDVPAGADCINNIQCGYPVVTSGTVCDIDVNNITQYTDFCAMVI